MINLVMKILKKKSKTLYQEYANINIDNNNNENNLLEIENKEELYKDYIKSKDDDHKKYYKKRIKERIIHNKNNENEIEQKLNENENKENYEIKKLKKEIIFLNKKEQKNKATNDIILNKIKSNIKEMSISFKTENGIGTINKKDNINIDNLKDNIDINIKKKENNNEIINTDLKRNSNDKDINKNKTEKKIKNKYIKSKSNDKILKNIIKNNSKNRNKDKSLDSLNNISYRKVRDKSKERRIKIKRENCENNLNHSFDNILEYNNKNYYTYEFKNEQKLIYENISIMDKSFASERPESILKTINNNNNNLKLVNKNYNKEKQRNDLLIIENTEKTVNDENINKGSENENKIKESQIKDNCVIKDDDKSNDDNKSNDLSKDDISNDLSIDDISIDKNIKQNNKKKKKKIIKKKRKIKKINISFDEPNKDLKNDNKVSITNDIDIKEQSIINNKEILKEEDIIKEQIIKKENIIENNIENKVDKENKEKTCETKNITQEKNDEIQNKNLENSIIKKEDITINQNKKEIYSLSVKPNIKIKKKLKKTKLIKKKKKKIEDLSKSFDDINKISQKLEISTKFINEKKIQRSNSFDIINIETGSEIEATTKINSMKFDFGISCLLEISDDIFAAGNLIGDIIIIDKKSYKIIQTIKEHIGTINSLFKMKDGAILSTSADKFMKIIRLSKDYLSYYIEFIFDGYNNYIFKGIELNNNKIISCSWDDKLFLWEKKDNKYINTLKFNQNKRVEDILEISINKFSSISEGEIKIWDSNNMSQLHSIKIKREIVSPNSLCKINDEILVAISYNAIHLIDLIKFNLIKTIKMEKCNLIFITKLNDDSILIGEDKTMDNYIIFYLKQFILDENELTYYSFKKEKFYKTNKNNYKEIRALMQFYDGIIALGISGQFDRKDSGDIFFYQ